MSEIKKILCVVDPTTDDQPAVERAAWLAKQTGASLELFVCFYDEYNSSMFFTSEIEEQVRAQILGRHEEKLKTLAGPLSDDGIKVTTKTAWDRPLHDGIVREAVRSKADVVLKDTHHHSALQRAVLTNTDWNLIRTCPAPLWLVKNRALRKGPLFVAAVDPTNEHDKPAALDDSILAVGHLLAGATDAELHAFHSYDPRIMFAAPAAGAYAPVSLPYDEIENSMRSHHGKRFDELAEFHKIADDRKHLVSGAAHEELPEIASKLEADVVIMGAIARNKWQRLFVGATAERTLEALPCDMLIIKPDWFKTPVANATDEEAA